MNNLMMILSRNKPGIMMGLGIGSMITSIISGIEFSPMARDALREKEDEIGELSLVDKAITVCPYFIPTVTFACAGIACVLGANNINLKNQAAAMTACAISETTNQIYREKVRDIVGDRKEKTIHEAAAAETYRRDYNDGKVMVISGNSTGFSMYDSLTKQRFKSNIERVHSTINNLNRRMLTSDVTIDDYCLAMGEYPMELGKNLGWNIDRGFIELEPFTAIVNEDGEPMIVITHRIAPRELY